MSANCYVSYEAALAQLQIEHPHEVFIDPVCFTTQVKLTPTAPIAQLWVHNHLADGSLEPELEYSWPRDPEPRDALERFFREHSICFRVVY